MKRKYPVVTPDTLRSFLHTNKAFFDLYVKKNNGYVDSNGSVYNGTVNNFGGELLVESRKLLLNKPNIDKIKVSSEFLYYFDITYAGDVNTYEHQNLIICTLKENVFTDNHTWQIKLPCESRPMDQSLDTIDLGMIHSLTKSDPIICKEKFYQTNEDIVIVKDGVDIPIKFSDSEIGHNTIYARYWYCDKQMYTDILDPDDPENNHIIGIKSVDDMTNSEWKNQIMFYIQNNALNTVPYSPIDATAYDGFPLLRYGTNGHDNSFVFPGMEPGTYESDTDTGNLPEPIPEGEDYKWFIELIPARGYSFRNVDWLYDKSNDFCVIDKVVYYRADTFDGERYEEHEYNIPSEYIHHFPNNNIVGFMEDGVMYTTSSHSKAIIPDNSHVYYDREYQKYYTWNGNVYKEMASDCQGIQYYTDENEVVHGYASFDNYRYNYRKDDEDRWVIVGLLRVEYQPSALYNYEYLKGNAVSGIHINSTCMHSDNGIIQKNGITHNMCDFDGLPSYFQNFYNNRNVCISRSIIYAIRDNLNQENQSATDKPSAALIVDSGYPITQVRHSYDMDSDIHYVDPYSYEGDGEYSSTSNYLSDIAYVDDDNFADISITGQNVRYRFIYHGNHYFSTDVMEFDPDMNYGRVYYISNDPAKYSSNLDGHIPGRTVARICDIPTSFAQLHHIPQYAPTYVVDDQYNRTESPYYEDEQLKIWNEYVPKWIRFNNGVIFPKFFTSYEMYIDYLYPENNHHIYDNLNCYIQIPSADNTIIVNDRGHGYSVGDTFSIQIGGQTITGIVETENSGEVLTVTIDETYTIHHSFLSSATTFAATTIDGSGTGLTLDVNVQNYDSYLKQEAGYPEDMFCLMFDSIDNLWIYNVTQSSITKEYKLSGVDCPDNPYTISGDNTNEMEDVFINDLMEKNIFIPNAYINKYNNDEMKIPINYYSPSIPNTIIPLSVDITLPDDLSEYLEMIYQDEQNSMFFIYGPTAGENHYRTYKIESYPDSSVNNVILPKNHQVNLDKYSNMSCAFSYTGRDKSQMDMCIFNPWKETISGYTWIGSGTYLETSIRNTPSAIVDSIDNQAVIDTIHDASYVTLGNVYMSTCDHYNGWVETLQNELENMTREELLQYIEDTFKNEHCEPLEVERSYTETIDSDIPVYRYTKEDLIRYIIENTVDELTKVDGVHLVQTVNTRMNSEEYHAMGDFQLLDVTTYDPEATVNTSEQVPNNICYAFKFDTLIANFQDFRMYDADGVDISDKCLIIYDGRAWYMHNNTWINV